MGGRRGAVVKAACLEVGDRGFEPHSGLRDLKPNARARISKSVSGRQCHLIYQPMCTKVA